QRLRRGRPHQEHGGGACAHEGGQPRPVDGLRGRPPAAGLEDPKVQRRAAPADQAAAQPRRGAPVRGPEGPAAGLAEAGPGALRDGVGGDCSVREGRHGPGRGSAHGVLTIPYPAFGGLGQDTAAHGGHLPRRGAARAAGEPAAVRGAAGEAGEEGEMVEQRVPADADGVQRPGGGPHAQVGVGHQPGLLEAGPRGVLPARVRLSPRARARAAQSVERPSAPAEASDHGAGLQVPPGRPGRHKGEADEVRHRGGEWRAAADPCPSGLAVGDARQELRPALPEVGAGCPRGRSPCGPPGLCRVGGAPVPRARGLLLAPVAGWRLLPQARGLGDAVMVVQFKMWRDGEVEATSPEAIWDMHSSAVGDWTRRGGRSPWSRTSSSAARSRRCWRGRWGTAAACWSRRRSRSPRACQR
ncbi:unnamed protein product, partial [Prorocentrum cordatum]